MIQQSEVIEIGRICRPHGKMGEIQLVLSNDLWEDNATDDIFIVLNMDSILVPFRILDWRGKGIDNIIMHLLGVDTEETATRLTGKQVFMLRRDCTSEDSDSELLTWQDLVGYTLMGNDGCVLGTISNVDETTINTLAELNNGTLVPLHEDLIIALDTDNHAIQINYSM